MSINEEEKRFLNYFRTPDSEDPVPEVAEEDLLDFESNAERSGMQVVQSIKTRPSSMTIRGLFKLIEAHPFYPRPGDLGGPYIDSSVYPPVQVPGMRVYRPAFPSNNDEQ